ncbi:hypothetical protein [Parasegetibacter sp. NRK P23]|uniref:hypothetical protein n=1 Tax=Parasegetibacter sp. NRK P23 TaxID=2942999 RepID=UPI00204363E0|nr:hypothetical protein [Parasegetibacter sp. NRK P23]MCM5527894.1 hypothetical protein [Parasegetibacter sp. NRK P23]
MQDFIKLIALGLVTFSAVCCAQKRVDKGPVKEGEIHAGLKRTQVRCTFEETKNYKLLKKKGDSTNIEFSLSFQNNGNYAYLCERVNGSKQITCQVVDCDNQTQYTLMLQGDSLTILKK